MSEVFEVDRIEAEKDDPVENSSLRFINVPLVLLAFFLGFGISYLSLQTGKIDFTQGDSRTLATDPHEVAQVETNLYEVGAQVYKKNCQACHQAGGQGLGATFPPLDGSEWVVQEPEGLTAIVLHGVVGEIEVKGQVYKGTMPPFKNQLSSEEIAAVATYVRTSWSNEASPVNKELVESVAQASSERKTPWQGGAELKEQTWK